MEVRCNNCGSNNVYVETRDSGYKGYGWCSGILGIICFGPIGLICGLCGMGSPKGRTTYVKCNNCGSSQVQRYG